MRRLVSVKMTRLVCPHDGCEDVTEDDDKDIAIALFNAHVSTHAMTGRVTAATSKSEKLQRPKILQGMLEESWNSFLIQWDIYRDGSGLSPADQPRQLLHTCDQDLLEFVLRSNPDIVNKSVDEIMAAIKKLAVVPVAMGVRRAEMLSMKQDMGDLARSFAAKLQGKAATCSFQVMCTAAGCNTPVEFTEVIVEYALINGLTDDDIKREILGWDRLDTCNLPDCIAYLEQKEMARDALKQETSASIKSSYKQSKDDPRQKKQVKCEGCNKSTAQYGLNRSGAVIERKFCTPCWKKSRKDSRKKESNGNTEAGLEDPEQASSITMIGGIIPEPHK